MISVGIGLLLLELSLRFLLFADLSSKWQVSRRFRRPELYASNLSQDYWKLDVRFALPGSRDGHPCFDWRFGWTSPEIDPETLASVDEERLSGRTPLLLFGDSFAHCVKRASVNWQDLIDGSEWGQRYGLLNYGVGAYGVDQMYLLMSAVLPRYRAQNPIVVVAILVDEDLDRSYIAARRTPKPRFTLEDGALVLEPVREETPTAYLRAHPLDIRSYVWRFCLFGAGLMDRDAAMAFTPDRDHVAVKQALNARLIAAMQEELEEQGLRYFFLLFHGPDALATPGPYGWQEPLLYATLRELGIPFVSSKRYLRDEMRRSGTKPRDFFFHGGEPGSHYTGRTNTIVFPAFLDGLAGRFEPDSYLAER